MARIRAKVLGAHRMNTHLGLEAKPRLGDRIRVGGRTLQINPAMATQTGSGYRHVDVISRTGKPLGDQPEVNIKKGSVIFRWIHGRIVPIRVK